MKRILFLLVILISLSGVELRAEKGFIDFPEIGYIEKNVERDKDWKITFNLKIDADSIVEENIYILDKNNLKLNQERIMGKDGQSVIISNPIGGYEMGEKYTLFVKDIKTEDGKNTLKQNVKFTFIIKSNEDNFEIEFGDKALHDEILYYYNKYDGEDLESDILGEYDFKLIDKEYRKDPSSTNLTKKDLEMLECFAYRSWSENTEHMVISSLKGLEYAVNLRTLSLSSSYNYDDPFERAGIEDISPLKELNKLELLRLSHNNIQDISELSGLTSLKKLYLSHNDISDLTPIYNLNITDLDIAFTLIEDIAPIVKFNDLRMLGVIKTPIKNFSVLSNMEELREFHASDSGLNNIDFLRTHINLKKLYIRDNNIANFKALEKIIEPEYIDANGQKIKYEDKVVVRENKAIIPNPIVGWKSLTDKPLKFSSNEENVTINYNDINDEIEFIFQDKINSLNLKISYKSKYEFYGIFEEGSIDVEGIEFIFE